MPRPVLRSARISCRICIAAILTLFIQSDSSLLAALDEGLVAYFPFEGSAMNLVEVGNSGVIHGASFVPGLPALGQALHFDGQAHVDIPLSPIPENGDFTVCLWVKDLPPSAREGLLSTLGGASPSCGQCIIMDPGQVYTHLWWAEEVLWTSDFATSEWFFLVLRREESRFQWFVNAIPATSYDFDGAYSGTGCSLILGSTRTGQLFETFTGLLDELRVYSRALSVDEIFALYVCEPTAGEVRIITQPRSEEVLAGADVELRVYALGEIPLKYQWRRDGVDLLNATNSTLALRKVSVATTGDYAVVVSNALGSVISQLARVTVTEQTWPFFADFEGAVRREWSSRRTDVTPVGNRRFLGQFGNDTVGLTLNALPPHQTVTVSFDLFVIRSWDGNADPANPDTWELQLEGGLTLLRASLLLWPHHGPAVTQSFPDMLSEGTHPARTGAVENNALGFSYPDVEVLDAVYHLVFRFDHAANSITLDFSGQGLEDLSNESWGLDNVRIELTPPSGVPYIGVELSSVGTIAAPAQGPAYGLAASGTRALVSVGDATVALLDLKDPANPLWLGSWEPLFPPSAFVLAGNTAYIASFDLDFLSTVEIVDFTDPAKPVLKGYYDTEGYALDLAIAANRLYIADDEAGLAIVDLGNPARPARIGGYATKRSFQRVEVAGRYAYVVDGDWLLILDVSDPAVPFRVGLFDMGGPVQALQVNWQTAYVLVGTVELRILDVSNPGNVRLVSTHRTWGVQSMAVAGKYAYLAKGNRGLEVVDLSDPAKPVWATGLSTDGTASDVGLVAGSVLVARGERGLLAYRLEQHINPPLTPPVVADGRLTLSWPAMEGVRLQRTTELVLATWEDVAESEGTNAVTLPITEPIAFFRLVNAPWFPSGMVARWPADGNANDTIGTSHGMLMNGVTFAPGIVEQAFSFDGMNGGVAIPPRTVLDVAAGEGFTVEAWILPSGQMSAPYDGSGPIVEWDAGVHLWQHAQYGNGLSGLYANIGSPGQDRIVQTVDVVSQNEWNHVALTYAKVPGTAVLYVNGWAVKEQYFGPINPQTSTPLRIGQRVPSSYGAPKATFLGRVDDLSLYNRALTADEIQAIYDAGSAGKAKSGG